MTNAEAIRLAFTLMTEHGLTAKGWTFKLNNNKSRLGVCKFAKVSRKRLPGQLYPITTRTPVQRIELSRHAVAMGEATVRNTLLHEISHALVGPGHGHNHIWKAQARAIGCTGDRCGTMHVPTSRYRGECMDCGYEFKVHRKLKNMQYRFHGACKFRPNSGRVKWDHLPASTESVTWKGNTAYVQTRPATPPVLRSLSDIFPATFLIGA